MLKAYTNTATLRAGCFVLQSGNNHLSLFLLPPRTHLTTLQRRVKNHYLLVIVTFIYNTTISRGHFYSQQRDEQDDFCKQLQTEVENPAIWQEPPSVSIRTIWRIVSIWLTCLTVSGRYIPDIRLSLMEINTSMVWFSSKAWNSTLKSRCMEHMEPSFFIFYFLLWFADSQYLFSYNIYIFYMFTH